MPPVVIAAAIAAGAGVAGSAAAAGISADAAQNIASAKLAQAGADRNAAVGAANPTTAELSTMDLNYKLQDQALTRQEQLLSAIDPAFLEAGKQALAQLRGQDSATLGPLREERAQQRSNLVNTLRSQMGEGAESSTAGIQALNKFDLQTSNLVNNAQQSSIGMLLDASLKARPNPYDLINANQNTLSAMQRQQGLQVSALNQTPITPYAGAGAAGEAAAGAGLSAISKSLVNVGGTIAGTQLANSSSDPTGTAGLDTGEISSLNSNLKSLND